MRLPVLSLVLILAGLLARPAPAPAFEVEAHRLFAVPAPRARLAILSATDIELFAPLIEAFQAANPQVEVDYTVATSAELMKAIEDEGLPFDLVMSSAMDLQTRLANDGRTQPYRSAVTQQLPAWANWRDHVLAFTQEPAVMVFSPAAFAGLEIPRSRQALITLLRANPDRFRGRIGTYDVRSSGLGYLFATQDARSSEIYWRLTEVFGRIGTRLYCCSAQMIDDVSSGRIAVAYNVLGSYARAHQDLGEKIIIVEPEDFTTVMLRTAVIPANAPDPALAGGFIDFLLQTSWSSQAPQAFPFPPVQSEGFSGSQSLRPIPIGPGLLVFLDRLKRQRFLQEWSDAMLQR